MAIVILCGLLSSAAMVERQAPRCKGDRLVVSAWASRYESAAMIENGRQLVDGLCGARHLQPLQPARAGWRATGEPAGLGLRDDDR